MSHEYTENELIQNSAGNLLHDELKWDVHFAYNQEVLGENGTFGRISYEDILLSRYFRAALKNLNSWIDERQISQAETIFKNRLSTASLMQINEEKYHLIRDGIPVSVQRPDGKSDLKRAIVIDFAHPDNNSFLAIKELKIHSSNYRRRTDIVGFVNGIPLLFIELKRFDVDVQNAYTDNYSDYLDTIPHLFYYNAFLMAVSLKSVLSAVNMSFFMSGKDSRKMMKAVLHLKQCFVVSAKKRIFLICSRILSYMTIPTVKLSKFLHEIISISVSMKPSKPMKPAV